MSDRRQELYDRIRQSSKDEVILEEMIRLGFWPKSEDMPSDPADDIRRMGELRRELSALRTEQSRLRNIDALKKEARRRRMAESRAKRKETKERRERERIERAEAWANKQQTEIVYVGPAVSAGLGQIECDEDRLERHGLPVLGTPAQLAEAMGIGVPELRFLCFARTTSTTSHYRRYLVPKKTGGTRLISAPMPRLKRAQRWVLDEILSKVPAHHAAHGFVAGRSIVTNARPHLRQHIVVNVDLKDFFPTVSYRRVRGLFSKLGYSEANATLLALLCTEPTVEQVQLDGQTYFVATSERALPQGAPTSPMITNLVCRRLDARLVGLSRSLGFAYSRYADDLSFSTDATGASKVATLLSQVRRIVSDEGFVVHPDKTRLLRRGRRQEVTGIVVNDQLALPRNTVRKLRAVLYQIERDGPEGKTWGNSDDVIAAVVGVASLLHMVDAEKAAPLLSRARSLEERYGRKPPPRGPGGGGSPPSSGPDPSDPSPEPAADREPDAEAPDDKPKKKKWWKLF